MTKFYKIKLGATIGNELLDLNMLRPRYCRRQVDFGSRFTGSRIGPLIKMINLDFLVVRTVPDRWYNNSFVVNAFSKYFEENKGKTMCITFRFQNFDIKLYKERSTLVEI